MRVLLVNPGSKFLIDDMAFPAMGVMYLSSYLKKNGYSDITFLNISERDLPDTMDYDVVGLYANTPQFPEAFRLSKKIKELNKNRDAVYVFGGPHVSAKPEDVSEDLVVMGEGEQAFLEIVRRKERGEKQDRISKFPYIKDLDSIPFPDRDIVNLNNYKYLIGGVPATSIITSRGCPFGCYFCSNNAWGKSVRMRSADNIYEELKVLRDVYHYGAFMFWDDTMTLNNSRMRKICDLIKSLGVLYRCNIRSDTVDLDMLKRMKDSGCVEVAIGIESGSQRILDTVNKGESVERNMEAVMNCHRAGLRVKGFMIIGLPGENRESIKETQDFLDEAELDDVDFSVYSPFPGSYIYLNADKFDLSFHDDYESSWYKGIPGKYKCLVSTSGLSSDEIVEIRDAMEKRYKRTMVNA